MPNKICAMLFLAALVAFTALFPCTAATEENCEPPVSWDKGGWTVTLTESAVREDHDGDPLTPDLYRYTYKVCKTGTDCNTWGLWHMDLAVPCCCPDEIELTPLAADGYKIYECGQGLPIRNWLDGYYQAYVAQFLSGSRTGPGEWSFWADTSTTGATSLCLGVSRWNLRCGTIKGPVCQKTVRLDLKDYLSVEFGIDQWVFKKSDPSLECYDIVYGCPAEWSDTRCIEEGEILAGTPIGTIQDSNNPSGDESATGIFVEGECIVWAQFGTGTTRCPIIGGKKYCR